MPDMNKITRPMKGATLGDNDKIPYPVLATPKIDGIRFLIVNGKAVTAQFKPIPNKKLRAFLEKNCQEGLDGELKILGKFYKTSSIVMSHEHPDWGQVKIIVFDYAPDITKMYKDRMEDLIRLENRYIIKLKPKVIYNDKELEKFEKACLDDGHEGVMLRVPYGPYKCGRSTIKQFYLVKLIKNITSEAKIIGFKQLFSNVNKQELNAFGMSKRSHKKEGKIPKPMVGSFKVIDGKKRIFFVGGLTNVMKKDAWENPKKYMNKIITYMCKPYGEKDLPRQARFKSFRKGF